MEQVRAIRHPIRQPNDLWFASNKLLTYLLISPVKAFMIQTVKIQRITELPSIFTTSVYLNTDGTTTGHPSRSWQPNRRVDDETGRMTGQLPSCSVVTCQAVPSTPSSRPGPRRLINLCRRTSHPHAVPSNSRPPRLVIRATIWLPAAGGMSRRRPVCF